MKITESDNILAEYAKAVVYQRTALPHIQKIHAENRQRLYEMMYYNIRKTSPDMDASNFRLWFYDTLHTLYPQTLAPSNHEVKIDKVYHIAGYQPRDKDFVDALEPVSTKQISLTVTVTMDKLDLNSLLTFIKHNGNSASTVKIDCDYEFDDQYQQKS